MMIASASVQPPLTQTNAHHADVSSTKALLDVRALSLAFQTSEGELTFPLRRVNGSELLARAAAERPLRDSPYCGSFRNRRRVCPGRSCSRVAILRRCLRGRCAPFAGAIWR